MMRAVDQKKQLPCRYKVPRRIVHPSLVFGPVISNN